MDHIVKSQRKNVWYYYNEPDDIKFVQFKASLHAMLDYLYKNDIFGLVAVVPAIRVRLFEPLALEFINIEAFLTKDYASMLQELINFKKSVKRMHYSEYAEIQLANLKVQWDSAKIWDTDQALQEFSRKLLF